MKILITGGAGFIGSHFIDLVRQMYPDAEIFNLDLLTYAAHLRNLENVEKSPSYHFIHGDIADKESVFSLFDQERFDIVVNFAAESHVDRSIEDASAFWHSNVEGVLTLLEACRRYPVKRFHQVSTDEVYGDLPLDSKELFDETAALKPSNPYSSSKASADLMVMAYYRTYGIPVTISRCGNNYGPRQFPEKLIPLMIQKAMKQEALPLYGNGKNIRDWIYVEDHCRAILCILEKGQVGEIYNVGAHCEKSNNQIVEALLEQLNVEVPIIYLKDRLGHDLRYGLNTQKIEEVCGWYSTVDFKQGLEGTIAWYQAHLDWWD